MSVFIKGSGCISPQKTFDESFLKEEHISFTSNRLKCTEPDYSKYFDAKQIRRMSRIIRMAVTSSLLALKKSGIDKPDAIITGTALGCLEDTEAFLTKMLVNKEDMLSPTPFIYSTHNTLSAQVALAVQSKGYNSTYVHRNISFESAIIDAMMLLNEGSIENALVGGVDELTDTSFTILSRLGHFKNESEFVDGKLFGKQTKGSVAGEGATFFVLANKKDSNCFAEVKAVQTISFPDAERVSLKAKKLLESFQIEKPDLVIAGYNGDKIDDKIFDRVIENLHAKETTIPFKHLCGEYSTSSAFAMWMAEAILNKKRLPFSFRTMQNKEIKNVLIYNQHQNIHHSLILLSSC